MTNVSGATAAMAVVAKERLRPVDERPSFRLMPVVIPGLPAWGRRVADWMAA